MTAVSECVGYAHPTLFDTAFGLEACTDGGVVHRLAPCGHCERCGGPLLSIVGELSKLCPGHGTAVAA